MQIRERIKIPKSEIPPGEKETIIQFPPGPPEFRKQKAAEEKERALREMREIINGAIEIEKSLVSLQYSMALKEYGPEAAEPILERMKRKFDLREGVVYLSTKLRERKDANRTPLDKKMREINDKVAQGKITKKEAHQLLNKTYKELADSHKLVVRNDVEWAALKAPDGKDHKIIWKPSEGEPLVKGESYVKGVYDIELKTQYLREWFARLVAEVASKGKYEPIVPETVIREVDGQIGSVQEFLENSVAANETKKKLGFSWTEANQEHLQLIAALDYIFEMRDNHTGNFMIDKQGNVKAIDRALTLTPEALTYNAPPEKFVLSYPLRLMSERKILPTVREQLSALKDPKIQEIIKKAAQFALGPQAEKLFNRMMKNLDRLFTPDEKGAVYFPHYRLPDSEMEKRFQQEEGKGKAEEGPPTFVVR